MTPKTASRRPFNILLVEDNDDDVVLTKHAFNKIGLPINIYATGEGGEALRFLRREDPFQDVPTPDLILIDLNMPGMDGRQLLAELKKDDQLMMIPAMVLSTSSSERDVRDAYRLHANAYLTKPMYLEEFAERTKCFVDFWLSETAVLPPAEVAGRS